MGASQYTDIFYNVIDKNAIEKQFGEVFNDCLKAFS